MRTFSTNKKWMFACRWKNLSKRSRRRFGKWRTRRNAIPSKRTKEAHLEEASERMDELMVALAHLKSQMIDCSLWITSFDHVLYG